MERRNFSQVLQDAGVDLHREYDRLYFMFYGDRNHNGIVETVKVRFSMIPFRGTCLSLGDFNDTYHFKFDPLPSDFDLNYLVNFCEYCFNLCYFTKQNEMIRQTNKVLELINYKIVQTESGPFMFVENSPSVTAVSEIVPPKVATGLLEYNHHSLKGNIDGKRQILKNLADYIEPKKNELSSIDNPLKKQLFYLFNNFNIRHNNAELGSKHNILLDGMADKELEQIYDDTYQLWLLATLELDNLERRQRIKAYSDKQGQ